MQEGRISCADYPCCLRGEMGVGREPSRRVGWRATKILYCSVSGDNEDDVDVRRGVCPSRHHFIHVK